LLASGDVDRAVLATVNERMEAHDYPAVLALAERALTTDPEHVPTRLVRARAYVALGRNLEAQDELREIVRLDPHCAQAFRLLAQLAEQRGDPDSAAIFVREAVRLDRTSRPAAVAQIPAPAAAAGRLPQNETTDRTRFAHGTQPPEDAPTNKVARVSREVVRELGERVPTMVGVPVVRRPVARGPTPELPGFGDYLVATGILTLERLRAAQAYQRAMRVQLSTAIVTLGLATPQRVEWAAVAHQSSLARAKRGE
jgi:tetratricopeptide (TPR) repeat protein